MKPYLKLTILGASLGFGFGLIMALYLRRKRSKPSLSSQEARDKKIFLNRYRDKNFIIVKSSSKRNTPVPSTPTSSTPGTPKSSKVQGRTRRRRTDTTTTSTTQSSSDTDVACNTDTIEEQYEIIDVPALDNESSIITLMNASIDTTAMNSSELCDLGMELLQMSLQHFELSLTKLEEHTTNETSGAKLKLQLQKLIEQTCLIQDEHDKKLFHKVLHNTDMDIALKKLDDEFEMKNKNKRSIHLSRSQELVGDWNTSRSQSSSSRFWSDSSSDNDSYASALSIIDFDDIEFLQVHFRDQLLITEGIKELQADMISCRKLRTNMCGCRNDTEFLVKLYSIRRAFNLMFKDEQNCDYFAFNGKQLLVNLLSFANKDTALFGDAFTDLIVWLKNADNWKIVDEELTGRGVTAINFYDIVLDFMLFDSFDDLERPPSSVITIAQNRWLSNGFKEGALSTAIWSVLKAKRGLLQYPNGFIAHFYAISEYLSPTMAWGFLGPSSVLKEKCQYFKDTLVQFNKDIFNFSKVRYTTLEDLSDDILMLSKLMMSKSIEVIKNE